MGDAQRLLRIEEEAPLKDQQIALLEQRVYNFKFKISGLRLKKSEFRILQSAIGMREAEVYRTTFEKENELTDRALKLAEVGKPKSNWELQGMLGLAAFVLGFLAGR